MTQVSAGPSATTVSAVLPGEFAAVQHARDIVHSVLSDWDAQIICEDVALVVSELVANALVHGLRLTGLSPRSAAAAPQQPPHPSHTDQVELNLMSTGSHLICTVRDPSPLPPVRRPADETDVGGRGLQLIESLSLCWGWMPGGGTKTVWAIFALDPSHDVGPAPEPAMILRAG